MHFSALGVLAPGIEEHLFEKEIQSLWQIDCFEISLESSTDLLVDFCRTGYVLASKVGVPRYGT